MGEIINFRTEFQPEKPPFTISLKDKIISTGSCFAEVVGKEMSKNKLNVLINPFGNIYNPHSLFRALTDSVNKKEIKADHLLQTNDCWYHFDYHSDVWSNSKEDLLKEIRILQQTTEDFLRTAGFIILTLGTSYVYKSVKTDSIVANCHKAPSKDFKKYLLSPKEIIDDFEYFKNTLSNVNSNVKIIFSVSPVRHLKDTIPSNSLSKSILRTAIHYICESFKDTYYFPAYELLMDDLRDYRFYKEDLIHPTEVAEKYIWNKFAGVCFDKEALEFMKQWALIKRALSHKPFHPTSKEHQRFLLDLLERMKKLNGVVDLHEEIVFVSNQIL